MGVFSIFPARASAAAGEVDALYGFLLVVSIAMTSLIFFLILLFAIKYRRRNPSDPSHPRVPAPGSGMERGPFDGDDGDVCMGHQAVFSELHAAAA
jgi:hypothetical protein